MHNSDAHNKPRPMSPHLQIYRPQLTSVLSVLHRGCGIGVGAGAFAFIAWITALSMSNETYTLFMYYAKSILGQLFLFKISFSFFYHLCCGIRHLVFDACFCLDIKKAYLTGYAVLAGSALMTATTWLIAYGVL